MNTLLKNKKSIALFVLMCICTIALPQKIKLSGQIISAETHLPVPDALIMLQPGEHKAVTDEQGNFQFNNLSAYNYQLHAYRFGYSKMEQNISLHADTTINFDMKIARIDIAEIKVNGAKENNNKETITDIDKLLRPVNTTQDLLTLVPGLFIAQHAGGGKAEQIFLRGFDSDHGTDFNISIDGLPVNMVSHAHGQGYADFHFVIPETVEKLNVYKGPYNAKFGDFSTSGTGEFFTKNAIANNEIKLEAGMFDTYRCMTMIKLPENKHILTKRNENAFVAGEYVFTNSYFLAKQKFNRYNLFGKYNAMLNDKNQFTFSASTFSAHWNASGQVPQRAVESGDISIYGSIDPSEGGQTNRSNVNATIATTLSNNMLIKNQLYYVNYYFNLYSNFTFFLNDSINGDEINQTDKRNIFGYSGTLQNEYLIGDKKLMFNAGLGSRNDIANIMLRNAVKREITDTVVTGKVMQSNINSFVDFTLDISQQFSVNTGLRFDYFRFQFNDNKVAENSGTKSIIRGSPKLNFFYNVKDGLQLFVKSGIGFHSNDARSVVINKINNSLPRAYGAEVGSEFNLTKRAIIQTALWYLYLESELVYVGDEATVETNNPTQRTGIDFAIRYQITNKLFADVDFNLNRGRLVNVANGENYIPLAPQLTSIGGLTYKQEKGFSGSLRYRHIDSRPANETNSVTAKGYSLFDVVLSYKVSKFEFGITAENIFNSKWNQAQFDTESRLPNETTSVSELHFTPGTPFFVKANVVYRF
ncbi:MAG: TonB-dependent receptor plug domain-containing protein [Bacteroidetes bacterium]|nr:TonB-dependent receptor plug domain-containing protein [Bacteroidota bacterium]